MICHELYQQWKEEERVARIKGWDFSHISGRYEEEERLPWDYQGIILKHLRADDRLLDIDTGGGEFLLSLGHQPENTYATEGYPPNYALCRETLEPKGIRLASVADEDAFPWPDSHFDMIINRHGHMNLGEIFRALKPGGLFITQQVGEDNDRELVELLTPEAEKQFPGMNLKNQQKLLEQAGFRLLDGGESFDPIRFFDVGALVWFARIISWEFIGFSVDSHLKGLEKAQRILEEKGEITGRTHRFFILARK
ncbi:MAG: class I SAM-dependent methyltransferase [Christensenellales bacterium]|jgi:SAM-dependent methyltransferase